MQQKNKKNCSQNTRNKSSTKPEQHSEERAACVHGQTRCPDQNSEEDPLGRGGPLLEHLAARGHRAPLVLLPSSPRRVQQLGPEARGRGPPPLLPPRPEERRHGVGVPDDPLVPHQQRHPRRAPHLVVERRLVVARAGALRRRGAGALRGVGRGRLRAAGGRLVVVVSAVPLRRLLAAHDGGQRRREGQVGQAVPQAGRADARPLLPVPPAPRALRLGLVVAHHHAAETEPATSSPTGPETLYHHFSCKKTQQLPVTVCGRARVLQYIVRGSGQAVWVGEGSFADAAAARELWRSLRCGWTF